MSKNNVQTQVETPHCSACKCPICEDRKKEKDRHPRDNYTNIPAKDAINHCKFCQCNDCKAKRITVELKEVPPFQIPQRIECTCNNCTCLFCDLKKNGNLGQEIDSKPGYGADSGIEPGNVSIPQQEIESVQQQHGFPCICEKCECPEEDSVKLEEQSIQQQLKKYDQNISQDQNTEQYLVLPCKCTVCICADDNQGIKDQKLFQDQTVQLEPDEVKCSCDQCTCDKVDNEGINKLQVEEILPKDIDSPQEENVQDVICICEVCHCSKEKLTDEGNLRDQTVENIQPETTHDQDVQGSLCICDTCTCTADDEGDLVDEDILIGQATEIIQRNTVYDQTIESSCICDTCTCAKTVGDLADEGSVKGQTVETIQRDTLYGQTVQDSCICDTCTCTEDDKVDLPDQGNLQDVSKIQSIPQDPVSKDSSCICEKCIYTEEDQEVLIHEEDLNQRGTEADDSCKCQNCLCNEDVQEDLKKDGDLTHQDQRSKESDCFCPACKCSDDQILSNDSDLKERDTQDQAGQTEKRAVKDHEEQTDQDKITFEYLETLPCTCSCPDCIRERDQNVNEPAKDNIENRPRGGGTSKPLNRTSCHCKRLRCLMNKKVPKHMICRCVKCKCVFSKSTGNLRQKITALSQTKFKSSIDLNYYQNNIQKRSETNIKVVNPKCSSLENIAPAVNKQRVITVLSKHFVPSDCFSSPRVGVSACTPFNYSSSSCTIPTYSHKKDVVFEKQIQTDVVEPCACKEKIKEIITRLTTIKLSISERQKRNAETSLMTKSYSSSQILSELKDTLVDLQKKYKNKEKVKKTITEEVMKRTRNKNLQNILCEYLINSTENHSDKDVDDKKSGKQNIPVSIDKEKNVDLTGFEIIDILRIARNTLIVRWNPPNSNTITGYDIFINGTDKLQLIGGSIVSAMIDLIDLSKAIHVSVFAVTKCGRCQPPAIAMYA